MLRKPIFLVILVAIVLVILYNISLLGSTKKTDTVLQKITLAIPPTPTPRSLKEELPKVINPIIEGSEDNYAIVIKNLETGETYNLNEHEPFLAASLYKLWVMAEVEREISVGDLTEDQVISQSVPTLNYEFGIDPEYAESTSGTLNYTVNQALNQMITVSDNYSALLLTEIITPAKLTLFVSNNNFLETEVGRTNLPKTSAYDVSQFFEKLYKGQLVNSTASQKMINILKLQEINDRIPKYLPENIEVAHKTGDIGGNSNDAGIVYSKNAKYVIVLLSQTNDSGDAGETMAKISQAVYGYFNQD